MSKKEEPIKVKISRLYERLYNTCDDVERGLIVSEIESLEKEIKAKEKEEKLKNMKLSTVSEAPVIMDRKNQLNKNFNGHNSLNPANAVNGVYENGITVVSF